MTLDLDRGALPIDFAVCLPQRSGQRGSRACLRYGRDLASNPSWYVPDRLDSSDPRQACAQRFGGVVVVHNNAFYRNDSSSVNTGIHHHQRHARFAISGFDRSHDGARAPILRQERRVNVDSAPLGNCQCSWTENEAERCDDEEIGICLNKRLPGRRIPEGIGLVDG